jgi:acyl-CoA synthetase (AMP-forming)/AMP-acid ligase II
MQQEDIRRSAGSRDRGSSVPVGELIRRAGSDHGETPLAFASAAGTISTTVGRLVTEAQVVAGRLEKGSPKGARVGVWADASVEGVTAVLACLLADRPVVPLLHLLGPNDLAAAVGAAQVWLLMTPDVVGRHATHEVTGELISAKVIARAMSIVGDDLGPGFDGSSGPWVDTPPTECLVVLTSGSSGRPKAVRHSASSLLAEVQDFRSAFRIEPGEWFMQTFPLGHVGAIVGLMQAVALGVPTVFLDKWSAEVAFAALQDRPVVAMGSTPYFLTTLLDRLGRQEFSGQIRQVMSGGAAVGGDLVRRADALGIWVNRCYGSSEHPTATWHAADATLEARATTDGKPQGGTEVRITDAAGNPVTAGVEGSVLLRGPEQFVGYVNGDARDTFLDDGWFVTGDRGVVSPDGNLTITGRDKDIVIRGGENISAAEVEGILAGHPAIVEAAVVAVPDRRFGEAVGVMAVLDGAEALTIAELDTYFRDMRVALHKLPAVFQTVEVLPRSAMGKVDKAAVRRALTEDDSRQ